MRHIILLIGALLFTQPAIAAEPSGCDKFAWPLTNEQRLLGEAQAAPEAGELDRDAGKAVTVKLAPLAEAGLPMAPERKPKDSASLAGYLQFGKAVAGHLYKVSLSEGVWIDLIQDGHYLKPTAFTGATDCPHIRKSVKFEIGPAPFTLQLSGVPSTGIAVVITPSD
jgi:hypothetical protein